MAQHSLNNHPGAIRRPLHRLAVISNQAHATPTAEEMGGSPKWPKQKPPVKYVLCSKCKQPGGTLLKLEKDKYIHPECQEEK